MATQSTANRLVEIADQIDQLADDDLAGDALREIAAELRDLAGVVNNDHEKARTIELWPEDVASFETLP